MCSYPIRCRLLGRGSKGEILISVSLVDKWQGPPPPAPQEVPLQWLARFECLQKGLQNVQYKIGRAHEDERQGVPITEAMMAD
ncbi:UNVERIFIED_CONTAM: hypothetical protein Sradi_7085300 [Sesamum radiatum]|uniref:Uncharacterized protein n=1 Tax=Sesamum radiatum TaxID=300843 RepID=A0AAW2J3I6_SESRA